MSDRMSIGSANSSKLVYETDSSGNEAGRKNSHRGVTKGTRGKVETPDSDDAGSRMSRATTTRPEVMEPKKAAELIELAKNAERAGEAVAKGDVLAEHVKNAELAREAEATGGVLAEHLLVLQSFVEQKNFVMAIRAVGRFAKDRIREGCGTKDMSIKAKSSTLPPFNAWVPLDQTLGKKGDNPDLAKKYTKLNEAAIAKGQAKAVAADVSVDSIYALLNDGCDLEIEGGWLRSQQEEDSGILIGRDFKSEKNPKGIPFRFWGERHGDKVRIFRAEKSREGWTKGEPVMLMANLDGKPVVADYDLALIAPRLDDFDESDMARGARSHDPKEIDAILEANSEEYEAREDLNEVSPPRQRSRLMDYVILSNLRRDGVSEKRLSEFRDDGECMDTLRKEAGRKWRTSKVVAKRFRSEILPTRSLGIISKRVKTLIHQLNAVLGRAKGQEVFHHGEDAANPYSVEADNYPMTVILPKAAAAGGDVIRIVHDHEEFKALVIQLKNLYYQVPLNEHWFTDGELSQLTRKGFTTSRQAVETSFSRNFRQNAAPAGAPQRGGGRRKAIATQEMVSEPKALRSLRLFVESEDLEESTQNRAKVKKTSERTMYAQAV